MQWNRNKCLMVGILCLLLGAQFRVIDQVVLNHQVSTTLFKQHAASQPGPTGMVQRWMPSVGPVPRQTLAIPDWLGWAMISIGTVLVLQSFVMLKPGGAAPA